MLLFYNNLCHLPLDEQFKFFEPLFGKKSLTYKNGPEARKKRQLVDRSFSHQAVTHYYEHFTKVFLTLNSFFIRHAFSLISFLSVGEIRR